MNSPSEINIAYVADVKSIIESDRREIQTGRCQNDKQFLIGQL